MLCSIDAVLFDEIIAVNVEEVCDDCENIALTVTEGHFFLLPTGI